MIFHLLGLVLWIFLLLLIGRLIFDWVQVFAREWRPHGVMLVLAEAVYTPTDPPLRLLRKVIPPLRIGQMRLDIAYTVLFLVVLIGAQALSRV